jgi:CRISPR/Cas system CSM-associated protein Csm3 (group 7 of RAMP superfamily)
MHKRLLNEATLDFTIVPEGPILVKAGETGADPTRPDMEFVRTWRNGQRVVYLPGPSLKGVIRSHCERIVRTVGRDGSCCNPVVKDQSCGDNFSQGDPGHKVHAGSCFICQMFGNTVLAGRVRTKDAYPANPNEVRTEERNGVAIDRVFGSVAVGPFQMEVVTSGEFETAITIRNFTIAQLGLLALALRDLKLGRVGVGFGKSRGLGHVTADFDQLTIRYMRYPRKLIPDSKKPEKLVGVARLLAKEDAENEDEAIRVVKKYGYRTGEDAAFGYTSVDQDVSDGLPDNLKLEENNWGEWTLTVVGERIEDVWKACIPAWKVAIRLEGGV